MTGLAPVDQQYIHWLATEDGSTVEPPPHGSLSPDPGPRRRRELLDLLAPVLEDSYRLPGALGASLVPDVNAYSVAYTAPAGELVRQRSRSAPGSTAWAAAVRPSPRCWQPAGSVGST
ncbi:MAG: hypothetical protein ACTHZK_07510 [Arthrobacter sp.]